MAFTLVAIKGSWKIPTTQSAPPAAAALAASTGTVTLRLDKPQTDSAGTILTPDTHSFELDAAGNLPTDPVTGFPTAFLAANTDPTTEPSGNFYHMRVQLPDGFSYSQDVVIPHTAAVDPLSGLRTFDLSTALPAVPASPLYNYASQQQLLAETTRAEAGELDALNQAIAYADLTKIGKFTGFPLVDDPQINGKDAFTFYDGTTTFDPADTGGGKINDIGFLAALLVDRNGNLFMAPKTLGLQVRSADRGGYFYMPGALILEGGPGIQAYEDIGNEGTGDEEQAHFKGYSMQSTPLFILRRKSGATVWVQESGYFPSGAGLPLTRQSPTTRTPSGSYPGSYGNASLATAGSVGVQTEVVQNGFLFEVPGQVLIRSNSPSIVKAKCNPGLLPAQPATGQRAAATIGIADTSIQLLTHNMSGPGRTDVYPQQFPFLLSIRKSYTDVSAIEIIRVNTMAGDTLTNVDRHVDGSVARQWQGPRTLVGTVNMTKPTVVVFPAGGLVAEDINCRVVVTGAGEHGDDLITAVSAVDATGVPSQLHLKDAILTVPPAGANALQVRVETSPVITFIAMPASDTTSTYQQPLGLSLSSPVSGYGTPPFNVRVLDPDNPSFYEILSVSQVSNSRSAINHGHIAAGSSLLEFDPGTGGVTLAEVNAGTVISIPEAGPLDSFGNPTTLVGHMVAPFIDADNVTIDRVATFTADFVTITIGTSNLATISARGVSGTTAKAWHDGAIVQPEPLVGVVIGGIATTAYLDSNGNHPFEIRQNGIARITVGSIVTIGDLNATRLGIGAPSQNNRGAFLGSVVSPASSSGGFGFRSEPTRNTASSAGVGLENFYSRPIADNPTSAAMTQGLIVGFTVADVLKTNSSGIGGVPTVSVQYGIQINSLSGGVVNYGLAIAAPGGAGSFPLWLGHTSDGTSAAFGLALGLSKDTTLFRGGVGQINIGNDLKVLAKFGCNGQAPVAKQTLPAAATDLASVIALANAQRTAMQTIGLS